MHDMQLIGEGEWLSSAQAAALLPATTAPTLVRWAKARDVPHVRLPSGRYVFKRSDTEALLGPSGGDRAPDSGAEDPEGAAVLSGMGKIGRLVVERGESVAALVQRADSTLVELVEALGLEGASAGVALEGVRGLFAEVVAGTRPRWGACA